MRRHSLNGIEGKLMITVSYEVAGAVKVKCVCEWCDCPTLTTIGVCMPCLMKLDEVTP